MKSKIFAAILVSSVSATAFAQVLTNAERLPVSGSGNCPTEIVVGSKGESFGQGMRFTVSTKDLLAPGEILEIQGVDTNTFAFTAALKTPYKNCVGLTETKTIFNELSTMQVIFEEGAVWVQVQVGPALNLKLMSNYNNQAIFDLAERL